jgi:hypothetical protein
MSLLSTRPNSSCSLQSSISLRTPISTQRSVQNPQGIPTHRPLIGSPGTKTVLARVFAPQCFAGCASLHLTSTAGGVAARWRDITVHKRWQGESAYQF